MGGTSQKGDQVSRGHPFSEDKYSWIMHLTIWKILFGNTPPGCPQFRAKSLGVKKRCPWGLSHKFKPVCETSPCDWLKQEANQRRNQAVPATSPPICTLQG